VTIGKETPPGFLKQLIDLDAGSCFFYGHAWLPNDRKVNVNSESKL